MARGLEGVRVMVIDDSKTIRHSAQIFLAKAGCEVTLAENGFDALAKIGDQPPDVILLDISMPRLDGYQTCALIRKSARHRATPVIMLSSLADTFDRARSRNAGSNQHLAKPFSKDNLLAAVAAHAVPRSSPTTTQTNSTGGS